MVIYNVYIKVWMDMSKKSTKLEALNNIFNLKVV